MLDADDAAGGGFQNEDVAKDKVLDADDAAGVGFTDEDVAKEKVFDADDAAGGGLVHGLLHVEQTLAPAPAPATQRSNSWRQALHRTLVVAMGDGAKLRRRLDRLQSIFQDAMRNGSMCLFSNQI